MNEVLPSIIDFSHTAVCSRYSTFFKINVGREFTEGRDARK